MKDRPGWMTLTVLVAFAIRLTGTAFAAEQLTGSDAHAERDAHLQDTFQHMSGDELFSKLLQHNQLRDMRLQQYSAVRTYEVANDKGKIYAKEVVRMDYHAPDQKSFVAESEKGSKLVRDLVLKPLIESESETSSGRAHRDSSIKPENYTLNLLGEEDLASYHCLVVEALPKRKDKYLFEGKVWIDTEDYAIVRIEGRPAKSPSFWITRADFVRQYQKIGEFWLPAKDETVVHVRLNGNKVLTIDHRDYSINCGTDGRTQDLPLTSRQANGNGCLW
jgi:Outer membrane lipoprotein-sorting protein